MSRGISLLFKLDKAANDIFLVKRVRLNEFGWDERKLQSLLFQHLDRVIQEEELLPIMESRHWQEEPDLMAVDKLGDLWIFELKAWESQATNILQALRYGQKFGQYDYDDLQELYSKFGKGELVDAFQHRFSGSKITPDQFNKNHHFVIITNGLDVRTREAIVFWKDKGLDVRPWIYRIYQTEGKDLFIEFNTFRTSDDPFEDIEEGYFIVNTNIANNKKDEPDMVTNKKAAAYFDPWKQAIKRIQQGDRVFLYSSGTGIIARGIVDSRYKKKDYHDNPRHKDEEYYVELENFTNCSNPLTASEIVKITGVNFRFMKTCFAIDKESGAKIWNEITNREKV